MFARDEQASTMAEDRKQLSNDKALIKQLKLERDEANEQTEKFREEMKCQADAHSVEQNRLMCLLHEESVYIPGGRIHQEVEPSHSELLYNSSWQVQATPVPHENDRLAINHQTIRLSNQICGDLSRWRDQWVNSYSSGMRTYYDPITQKRRELQHLHHSGS